MIVPGVVQLHPLSPSLMSDLRPPMPFLVEFSERRTRAEPGGSALGTETFTKRREAGDTDVAAAPRVSYGAALGTQSVTEQREELDQDEPPRRGRAAANLGTATGTAEREDGDRDEDVGRRTAVLLGTETGTRAREDADQDVTPLASLWSASVL